MKQKEFNNLFNYNYDSAYFSPGRVNLIGEHIDYNGGKVLPMAINYGTYGYVRMREDNIVRVYSNNFKNIGIVEFSLNDLTYKKDDDWASYVKGVFKILIDNQYKIDKGFDLLVEGTIPNGSGLSSSASLEILICVILNDKFNLSIDDVKKATLSQKVENEFIGVNCGIMDQFIIATAKKGMASLIDTNKLTYKFINADFKDYKLVIINSKKRRGLVDSEYNERRESCNSVLKKAKKQFDIENLCQLTSDMLNEINLNDKEKKRAEHVISEYNRVERSVKLLEDGDIEKFGELLNKSHYSLRDLFEVSCEELDYIVQLCQDNGSIGARMTGAGFGGCAIALFNNNLDVLDKIHNKYKEKFNLDLEYYMVDSSDKARRID